MRDQARHIDWQFMDAADAPRVAVGELVSVEAGGLPIYRVVSLADGRARLREIDTGDDRISPLSAFHFRAVEPA